MKNNLVDLCVAWGQCIVSDSLPRLRHDLEQHIAQLAAFPDLKPALLELLEGLAENRVAKAIECLTGSKTLFLTPEETLLATEEREIADEMPALLAVSIALHILDEAALLLFTLESMEALREVCDGEVAEAIARVNAQLYFADLQCHRLIPLNRLRNDRLQAISEEHRYLFPWHLEWSELEANTLSRFVDSLADNDMGEDVVLEPLLFLSLRSDAAFYQRLLLEAKVCGILPILVQEDYAWHALQKANAVADAIALPKIVIEAGRIDAAVRVAVQAILGRNTRPWRAEAALLGLGLDEALREQILNTLNPDDPLLQPESIASIVQDMVQRLEGAANQGYIPLPRPQATYRQLLNSDHPELVASKVRILDTAGSIVSLPSKFMDAILETVRDLPPLEVPLYRGVAAIGMGDEVGEGEQQRIAFSLDHFPQAPLSMPPAVSESRRGREVRYIRLLSEDQPPGLRQWLQDFGSMWWGGFAVITTPGATAVEVRRIDPTPGIPTQFNLGPGEECLMLTLFMHPDQTTLDHAMSDTPHAEPEFQAGCLTYVQNQKEDHAAAPPIS